MPDGTQNTKPRTELFPSMEGFPVAEACRGNQSACGANLKTLSISMKNLYSFIQAGLLGTALLLATPQAQAAISTVQTVATNSRAGTSIVTSDSTDVPDGLFQALWFPVAAPYLRRAPIRTGSPCISATKPHILKAECERLRAMVKRGQLRACNGISDLSNTVT